MQVLIITKIFPNACEPLSAPFNRQQFGALNRLCDVDVLASLPWFPGARLFRSRSSAGQLGDVPTTDVIDGIPVRHPRFLYLPKIGGLVNGPLYLSSLVPHVARFRGKVDVVLGAWAYPDGWAAVLLARMLGVPAVVKVHGTDMDVIAQTPAPRRMLQMVLPRAARVVAVSRSLAREVTNLGVSPDRVDIIYNGVDNNLFHLRDRAEAQAQLGLDPEKCWILFVGRLSRDKGFGELTAAFDQIAARDPHISLALIGSGDAQELVQRHGDRVRAVGTRPLEEIPNWLAACDLLTLPSWHEGTPNVVLEALACGRRVVASDVGGIPDLLNDDRLGTLVPAQDSSALADALLAAARHTYDPVEVADLGGRGDWATNAEQLHRTLAAAISVG